MEETQSQPPAEQVVAIARCDRWQVYKRLQELGIPCYCSKDGCLQAQINSPVAALQLWSVVRLSTAHRGELTYWLHRCWQQKA